jgi:hypothetical protein
MPAPIPPSLAFSNAVESSLQEAERLMEYLHRLSYLPHLPMTPLELAGAQQALDAVELTLQGLAQFAKAEGDRWHL